MQEVFRYMDVCAGISAASVAFNPLSWQTAFFSEIEPFPCRVLAHHYPDVENLGDMTKILDNPKFHDATIDLLCGGTPCQSFSIAGLRGGLADERGNLATVFIELLYRKRGKRIPCFLWENVPGCLTSSGGADFAAILSGFTGRDIAPQKFAKFGIIPAADEKSYSIAWRILDAQHFGVPQRRRRVFVVGYLGTDWRPPTAVLFEQDSLRRDFTPRREEGQRITGALTKRSKGRNGPDEAGAGQYVIADPVTTAPYSDRGSDGNLVPCFWDGGQTSQTIDRVVAKGQAMPEKQRFPAVICEAMAFSPSAGASAGSIGYGDVSPTLKSATGGNLVPAVVSYPMNQVGGEHCRVNPKPGDPAYTLTKREPQIIVGEGYAVRRFTPLECERLQGFPDNYTNIPKASNTGRYEALGNSMAVPVMAWIGRRIDMVNKLLNDANKVNGQ